jgi:hypothetical protein
MHVVLKLCMIWIIDAIATANIIILDVSAADASTAFVCT